MLQPIYYSILADEVTSDKEEHLAICARFVDEKKDVTKELLTFIKLERITGEKIAENILAFLKENNVPVTNMHGQGCDGASNMSSSKSGVQARINEEAPLATYVHCNGHCLNLVISKSCALPQVRNVIERLKNCCLFFLKGQMNQNFDIWSLVSLKQLNTKTDHYKVYSPNSFAS